MRANTCFAGTAKPGALTTSLPLRMTRLRSTGSSQALVSIASKESSLDGLARAKQIASGLSCVAGPYAFVFLDRERGHLYFGRDFLGRRSLCWRQTSEGDLTLCSITDGNSSHHWREVEADGVYFIDMKDVPSACSNERQQNDDPSSLNFVGTLAPYKFAGKAPAYVFVSPFTSS